MTWCKQHFGRLITRDSQGGGEQGRACRHGKHSTNVCSIGWGSPEELSQKYRCEVREWRKVQKFKTVQSKERRGSEADRKCWGEERRATEIRVEQNQRPGGEKLGGEAGLVRGRAHVWVSSDAAAGLCARVFMWLCSKARLWHKPCAVPVSPPSHCAPPLSRVSFSANKNKITHKINGNNLLFPCHRKIFFYYFFFFFAFESYIL